MLLNRSDLLNFPFFPGLLVVFEFFDYLDGDLTREIYELVLEFFETLELSVFLDGDLGDLRDGLEIYGILVLTLGSLNRSVNKFCSLSKKSSNLSYIDSISAPFSTSSRKFFLHSKYAI